MKLWTTLILMTILGGCVGAQEAAITAAAQDQPAANAPISGRIWLPPSNSQEREETRIPIPIATAGARVTVRASLGSTYGPATVPPLMADVDILLLDATGEEIARGHLGRGATDATLEGEMKMKGDAALVLLSYGGSDGSANGDHVDCAIEIS